MCAKVTYLKEMLIMVDCDVYGLLFDAQLAHLLDYAGPGKAEELENSLVINIRVGIMSSQ